MRPTTLWVSAAAALMLLHARLLLRMLLFHVLRLLRVTRFHLLLLRITRLTLLRLLMLLLLLRLQLLVVRVLLRSQLLLFRLILRVCLRVLCVLAVKIDSPSKHPAPQFAEARRLALHENADAEDAELLHALREMRGEGALLFAQPGHVRVAEERDAIGIERQ